ncbi:MAG: FtsX-like permease family protein [Dysosmobacter welbionis]
MRNGRFYGPYLLSCGMTAAMYYSLLLTFSDIVASVRGRISQSLMYLGRLVVTLFSAVLLLYANSFVMKRRRRELGLYNILGLEKRHTARLMVWETLYRRRGHCGRARGRGAVEQAGAAAPIAAVPPAGGVWL